MVRINFSTTERHKRLSFSGISKIIFSVFNLLLLSASLQAQDINIIPRPLLYTKGLGQFQLNNSSVIGMNDNALLPLANYLQTELRTADSMLVAVDPIELKATIDLQLVKANQADGAYTLKIEPQKITISSASEDGVFYGIVSLLQIVKGLPACKMLSLETGTVIDAPRYQWRGFMLDESRHFFGREKVKQLLDWMAFYKLNKFHWHLTDVNGWRLEIKKYPKLTAIGGIGNYSDTAAEAKYYTQDDIRDIVAYAKDRFITVIPEIDMPGHATAANKAYPEYSGGTVARYPNFTFDPANEKTYQYLADILKETNSLFPSKMIHLGGDEVALGIQAWSGRPEITTMLVKNRFESLADLEHYFFRRMADSVIAMNDKVLCWDEAAETDLPADKTIVFWWRQNVPSALQLALKKKYQVVLCPRLPMYFDFIQSREHVSGRRWIGAYNSVNAVYNFPYPEFPADQLQSKQILGVQANLWTELVGSAKRLDFLVFPRMAALAEVAWTDSARKDENSFNTRLCTNFPLYDKAGIYYYDPFDPSVHPEVIDFVPKSVYVPEKPNRHKRGRNSRSREHHKNRSGLTGRKQPAKSKSNSTEHPKKNASLRGSSGKPARKSSSGHKK